MTAAAAVLNLAVTAVAVPLYGAWGAVAAVFASEMLGLALGIVTRRRLGLYWHPILPAILPPLLCSVAAVAVIAALPRRLDHLWWLELAGGAVMVGVCMLLLERHRLRYAWQAFRSR
jgi:O-antigen/teichoic acid export membrane protein